MNHDDYLFRLRDRIKNDYKHVWTKRSYWDNPKSPLGEIDILAQTYKGDLHIFEVKSKSGKPTAIKQLTRAKKRLSGYMCRTFYYEGRSDRLEELYL